MPITVHIKEGRGWNPKTNEFVSYKDTTLTLEHSLISLSKWESMYQRPFLSKRKEDTLTSKEIKDYIKCMSMKPIQDENVLLGLTNNDLKVIFDYINDPHTATTIREDPRAPKRPSRETVTAELIYYWMIAYNIPFSCEKWHLNNLLTLIHVCAIKNQPPKKMSKNEIMRQNRALNNQRKAKYHTRG